MCQLRLGLFIALIFTYAGSTLGQSTLPSPPFNQCPSVGADSGCAILLVIDVDGSLRVVSDPSQGPYDRVEDTLFGVQNNSPSVVLSIPLRGASPIFGFDGDGICGTDPSTGLPFQPAPSGCPFGPTTYEGPGVSFTNISPDGTSGTVNFAGGIPANGGTAYFSLEGVIQSLCPAITGVPLLHQYDAPWAPDTYDHLYVSRAFANANMAPVSPTGNLELVIFPIGTSQPSSQMATTYQITLTSQTNNLNGLRDAINGLNAGVSAAVTVPQPQVCAAPCRQVTLTPSNAVNSIQLRQTPGNPSTNILTAIRNKGCYLTSTVMIINYHAAQQGSSFTTTPRDLNNFLNNQPNGYVGAGAVNPTEVVNFARQNGVDLSYDGMVTFRDDFTLDSYICSGNPVSLKVGNPHFVVATGQTTVNGTPTYSINDPGHSNRFDLSSYNLTYTGIRLFSTKSTPPSALYVGIDSPLEVLVIDPSGRRTGTDPVAGTTFQEIPSSGYDAVSLVEDFDPSEFDPSPEVKTLEVLSPMDGTYFARATGTGSGPFTLDFIGYDVNGHSSSMTFTGMASPGVTTVYQVTYSSAPGAQIKVVQASDTTPPVTIASLTPTPNASGWNNSNVTVNLTSTDNEPGGTGVKEIHISLSGAQTGSSVIAGATASVTVSAEGTTIVTYFGVDNAGNVETAKTLTVQIDKTPPSVAGMPTSACALWPPDHKLIQVATVSASDSLSGLAAFAVNATSSEAGADPDPEVVITGTGLQPRTVQLRAERLGNGPGRVYTITATATDVAGNLATVTAACKVPHDQGQ